MCVCWILPFIAFLCVCVCVCVCVFFLVGSSHSSLFSPSIFYSLQPLEKDNETYKLISDYLQNTHAATHSSYKLRINNIFEVKRDGEAARFAKYSNLHNRKLLWHGSRITNWVSAWGLFSRFDLVSSWCVLILLLVQVRLLA